LNTYQERRKKNIDRRKQQMVRNWLSSFVVTVAVVVAVVVFSPVAPQANFISVEAFGTDIFYHVKVEDVDGTITPGSLKIIAENPLEYYEQELPIGTKSGAFEGLKPKTEYTVSIKAKRGFGEEVLSKETIKTDENYGGRIITYQPVETTDPYQYEVDYVVGTSYNDIKEEIQLVQLKYTYLYEYDPETTVDPLENDFTTIMVTAYQQTSILERIPNHNVYVFIQLEAQLKTGEWVILHKIMFRIPIILDAFVYVDDGGPNYLKVSVYPDYETIDELDYFVRLIRNGVILKEVVVPKTTTGTHYGGSTILFDRLKVFTNYHVELVAQYVDPSTNEHIVDILMNIKTSTTQAYDITIDVVDETADYLVELDFTDRYQTLRNVQYIVYSIQNEYEMYEYAAEIVMEIGPNNSQYGVVTIPKPNFSEYLIKIVVDKYIADEPTFYWATIYEISSSN